ncbi:MAG: arsenate reductase (glutaredoxin) [Flavobacteriaceae bacterium]
MIKIYHNPRCAKSREGLAVLEKSGKDFEIVLYLKDTPSKKELESILKKLGYSAMELIRKNEAVWKEHFKGKELSEEALIEAMVTYPKLIERPIVITEKKAVVGRPADKIKELL